MQKVSLSNKVFTENPLLDEIVYNARQLATGVIVKDYDKANNFETVESIQNGDMYIACTRGLAKFENFQYDLDILRLYYGGSVPEETLIKWSMNNKLIPEGDRQGLFNLAYNLFMNNYIEYNNYYRQLNGEPYYDSEGIWEGLWIDIRDIDESIPISTSSVYPYCPDPLDLNYQLIHKLSGSDIAILESNGTLESIINDDYAIASWGLTKDEVRYLDHLGARSVDYYTARTADRFVLLYCPSSDSEEVRKRFKDLFEANRLYLLYTSYSEAYKYKSDYYDNFMMAFLVIQTIIDMIIELPEYIIRRDIFDTRTCKYIFESNGVKYFNDIPIKYQVSLVKNLNKLIKFKSTDKCIIDIISIFGIDNINVFKYYILKDRRVKNPELLNYANNKKLVIDTMNTTEQKTIIIRGSAILILEGRVVEEEKKLIPYDEEAEVIGTTFKVSGSSATYKEVEDNDKNYDLRFIKVPLLGKYDDCIRTESNIFDYDTLVESDSYWEGDKTYEDVKSEIKDLDFNVLRSKYYSIEAVIDLTKRNFTLIYFLNMLMFNKVDVSKLLVNLPNVSTSKKFTLTNSILTLYALSYIYYNVEDTIMDSRLKVAQVLGFNLEADLAQIADDLYEKHGRLTFKDLHVDKFTVPEDNKIMSVSELKDMFFTNKDVHDFVQQMLIAPPNKRLYDAYKFIYDSMFIMNCNMRFFIVDGEDLVKEYEALGYESKFVNIPKESDYPPEKKWIYEKDYAHFISTCKEDYLYFDISEDFDYNHLMDLYIFHEDTKVLEFIGQCTMASTFREYLKHYDATLFNFVQDIANIQKPEARQEACINAIQSITTYLREYIDDERGLSIDIIMSNTPSISLDFIKKYVEEVIDFFKSFKIFSQGSSIIYVIDDKFESYVKLIEDTLFKYLFDKAELIRMEDHIGPKIQNVSGLLLHVGNGLGLDMYKSEAVDMIDKVWLDINTWIYKHFTEFYNSDKYSELTCRIKDQITKYRAYKNLDEGIKLLDMIAKMLIKLSYVESVTLPDSIKLNETRQFNEYYNEWMSEIITIMHNMILVEGEHYNTIYFCPECNKQVEATTEQCPYCRNIIVPTQKKLYRTHIKDYNTSIKNKMKFGHFAKIVDGINSEHSKLVLSDPGMSEISDTYYKAEFY